MIFRILGALTVEHEGHPIDLGRRKQRSLLALALVHVNAVVSTDRLMEELWPGARPADGAAALQVQVSRLRRALAAGGRPGHERLESRRPGYILHVDADEFDAAIFLELAAAGRAALGAGDHRACVDQLDQALALWRGRPLGEFADAPFAMAEVTRLEEARLAALETRLDALAALGHHAVVAGEARLLVDAHPSRERFWGQLILALYRGGRQSEALRAYGEVRAWLGEELGIEPSAELRQLEERILLQNPELDWAPPAVEPRLVVSAERASRPQRRSSVGAALASPDGPLVGRAEPLGQLLAAFEAAVNDGPRLVRRGPRRRLPAGGRSPGTVPGHPVSRRVARPLRHPRPGPHPAPARVGGSCAGAGHIGRGPRDGPPRVVRGGHGDAGRPGPRQSRRGRARRPALGGATHAPAAAPSHPAQPAHGRPGRGHLPSHRTRGRRPGAGGGRRPGGR